MPMATLPMAWAPKIKSTLDGLLADGTGFFSSKDNLLKKAKKLNETEVQTVEDRAKRLEASLTARCIGPGLEDSLMDL